MATKRGYYRAELERSIDNIEMALTHLARVVDAYKEHYPDISSKVEELGNALVTIAELIRSVHDAI